MMPSRRFKLTPVLALAACCVALPVRGAHAALMDYQSADGSRVFRVKRLDGVPASAQPADGAAAGEFLPDITLTPERGPAVTVKGLPSAAVFFRNVDTSGLQPQSGEADLTLFLSRVRMAGYDASSRSLVFAAPQGADLTFLVVPLEQALESLWVVRHGGDPRPLPSGSFIRMFASLVDAKKPDPKPSLPASDETKAELFLSAKNHPPSGGDYDIQWWTTPFPVARYIVNVEKPMLYRGLLKKADKQMIVLTTWTGDIALTVRAQGTAAAQATQLLRVNSADDSSNSEDLDLNSISSLELGQFVAVYGNEKTLEAERIVVFRRAEP